MDDYTTATLTNGKRGEMSRNEERPDEEDSFMTPQRRWIQMVGAFNSSFFQFALGRAQSNNCECLVEIAGTNRTHRKAIFNPLHHHWTTILGKKWKVFAHRRWSCRESRSKRWKSDLDTIKSQLSLFREGLFATVSTICLLESRWIMSLM